MSYEIVRSIKVDKKNKKVYITGASNNVQPRTFTRWNSEYLAEIFETQGHEEVIKEILYAYYEGNFQAGTHNDYSKSLTALNRSKYNWSTQTDGIVTKEEIKEELLKNYLTLKTSPKGRYVIYFKENRSYVRKFSARRAFTTSYIEYAKIYKRKIDAELSLRNYTHLNYVIDKL